MIQEYIDKYKELGWVVMPIAHNEKRPVIKNWSKITSNEETIGYFNEGSNLGVIMGKASGVMCVDVDIKHADGLATLADLEEKLGELPKTVMSETPSGGIHYYFKYDKNIINRKKVGEGIDIQSDGTQTLEAPSVIDGNTYEWVYDPFEYEVAELPENWLTFLCNKGDIDELQLSAAPFEAPKQVPEGGRNNTIAQFVGSMLGRKLQKNTVLNKALKYNQEACDPPLDDDEVRTIVESMIKTDISHKSERLKDSINENLPKTPVDTDKDSNTLPPWIFFDETGTPSIDEKKFAEWYVGRNEIHCVNGRFFSRYGLIADGWFESNIHNIIGTIVKTKLAAKVSDLLKAVKNECFKDVSEPDPYKIQFDNCAINVENGRLEQCEDFFTLHQIPHNYNPDAKCPIWLSFMKTLFHEEDIRVVQEFLGYCLVPNTLCQTSLFITGEGGEGKSRITIMLEHILGENSVVIGDFKGLQDKFSMSSLDNQMLFIDDDLSLDALDDTSNFKKIVTAETMLEVEPKGKPKYKTKLYSRILCCGNGAVTSKFDRSDGFYRRLLVCKVKPIAKDRKVDRRLSEKLKKESEGIINWMLEGLLRVVNNGFVIDPSDRMAGNVKELRDNSDTISLFMKDEQYIEYTLNEDDRVSIKQLHEAYEDWCNRNAYICIHKNSFSKTIRRVYKQLLKDQTDDSDLAMSLVNIERATIDGKQVRSCCGIRIKNYKNSFTVKK